MRGFYFISDSLLSREGNLNDVAAALKAGVEVVQYREKNKSSSQMYQEALKLRALCKNTTFIINDRVDIALAVGADGVHIGQEDFPYMAARRLLGSKKIIGVTVHSLKEAVIAEKSGADYLGVSAIFGTRTKSDAGRAIGIEMLKAIRKKVAIPVVAIGGITLSNASQVIASGADCLCAISAVVASKDVRRQIEKFQRLFPVSVA